MEPQREEHKGHVIELRDGGAGEPSTLELLIDNESIRYGTLPDGLYFLDDYAYDWRTDLMDLARRFIDHRIKSNETQSDQ